MGDVPEQSSHDLAVAEALRWGVSRLASRLRAEQPGSGRPLTRLAASVLANLRHSGPLTASELAAIEGLQSQSLTRTLNELDEQGRIRRSRSEADARRQNIEITGEGREALREHVRDGNAWLAAALRQTLSPAERGVLQIAAGLLEKVAEAEVAVADNRRPQQASGRAEGAAPAL